MSLSVCVGPCGRLVTCAECVLPSRIDGYSGWMESCYMSVLSNS